MALAALDEMEADLMIDQEENRKRPSADGDSSEQLCKKPAQASATPIQKKPSIKILKKPAQASGVEPSVEPTDEDAGEGRDRLKARKFMAMFDSMPPEVKKYYNNCKTSKDGQGRRKITQLINTVVSREGNQLIVKPMAKQ
eukprot:5375547-Lingulodinium_polyedra.AAC.1